MSGLDSTQDPIPLQLPMGQEGSFEDENEGILGLDLAQMSDSERQALIQSLLSQRLMAQDPAEVEAIDIKLEQLGVPRQAAQGGYMESPG